jgi:hypothetical protein
VKNTINKLLVNHSLFYKALLYVATVILVVYLFPKSGHFKYEFQKGKPWQYENYYAPFDFAIQKTQEEIDNEILETKEFSKQYFYYNEDIVANVKATINELVEEVVSASELSKV